MPASQPPAEASRQEHGPLAGIRVLDLSSVVMGPLSTQILGDLGADVITNERSTGDTNRVMGSGPHEQLSGVALNLHRNKRNVSIDIKHPQGHALLMRIIATCDVVVTNLRPGVLARARLSYEDVRAVRPDVIFCQAHGFASDSPRADEPAYDDIVQAASGVSDAARRAGGTPALMPTIFADKVCALTIVYAVTAALVRKERTGEGEHIEIPMVDTMRAFMLVEHGSGGIAAPGEGRAGYPRILTPHRRPQQTADGWISVLPYSKAHYDDLFGKYLPHLVGDPRYADGRLRIANSDFLYEQVRSILIQRTTDEWLEFCRVNKIPASPDVSLDELVDELPDAVHPLIGTYKSIPFPVRFENAGTFLHRPAPLIGQDTAEILAELGIDAAGVSELEAAGVITRPLRVET
jgi:crotonobetainyl-CoA:carnitine CoA-transferase CaiB-like acyl-CoA transferase